MQGLFKELAAAQEVEYQCDTCNKKVTAMKKLSIHLPPPVLVVHFKRFIRTVDDYGCVGPYIKVSCLWHTPVSCTA